MLQEKTYNTSFKNLIQRLTYKYPPFKLRKKIVMNYAVSKYFSL